jgi:hypothetical protein
MACQGSVFVVAGFPLQMHVFGIHCCKSDFCEKQVPRGHGLSLRKNAYPSILDSTNGPHTATRMIVLTIRYWNIDILQAAVPKRSIPPHFQDY